MLAGLLMIMLAQASPGVGAGMAPPPKPSIVTNPDWVRKPSGDEFARYYPDAAMRANLSGRATFQCQVAVDGSLTDCTLIEESPPGVGFGAAALKMASLFKMRPMMKDGSPVAGGTVRIPLRFEIPGGQMEPLTVTLACYGKAAAKLEQDPSLDAERRATVYFGVQVILRDAQAKVKPSVFEDNLRAARMAAQANTNPAAQPTLKQCVDFVEEMQPKPSPK